MLKRLDNPAAAIQKTEKILGLLGATGARIARVFTLMGIAEEEIARAGQFEGDFLLLEPPGTMSDFVPDVYRAHCRELLARRAAGRPLDLATDAEILCALSDASLRFPLNRNAGAAYVIVFRKILGHLPAARSLDLGDPRRMEDYEGAAEEILGRMRRHRVSGRRGIAAPRQARAQVRSGSAPRQATLLDLVEGTALDS
jgi:hypothetical protein